MTTSQQVFRTVVITGGNTGLGYQCAKTIAVSGQPWHIVIASRDTAKAAKAVEQLKSETAHEQISAMRLDLASLDSIRAFAREFAASTLPSLHAIVCNAGVHLSGGVTYTQDGFETTFGVNHLGHFLLVNLLLRSLIAPARIVFISSGTHDPATPDGRWNRPDYQNAYRLAWPEKDGGRPLPGIRRYSTSKLCNIYCTYELARRLEAEGLSTTEHPITVNAYDPGPNPETGLTRDYPRFIQSLLRSATFRPLLSAITGDFSTIETSGGFMASLVVNPALEQTTGKYYHIQHEMPSSQESYDRAKARELWESSVELVKLAPEETPLRLSRYGR